MKLSFSLNPKPSSSSSSTPNPISPNPKFLPEEEEEHQQTSPTTTPEFITDFTPSPTPHPNFTIPPLPNTWNPHPHNPNPNLDMDLDTKLLKKLREDIKKLPDHKGLEEVADVPVEGYGRALLAGYGWREGRGVGKHVKEDVKVKEHKGNVGRHGLGFVPKTD